VILVPDADSAKTSLEMKYETDKQFTKWFSRYNQLQWRNEPVTCFLGAKVKRCCKSFKIIDKYCGAYKRIIHQ
jgi:uncharacterized protein YfaT (DUF1175 family)